MDKTKDMVTMSKSEYDKEQEKAFDNGFQIAIQALVSAFAHNAINNILDVEQMRKIAENVKEDAGYERNCELIDKNKIPFHCSFNGDCMADNEKCKTCSDYVCSYKDVQQIR